MRFTLLAVLVMALHVPCFATTTVVSVVDFGAQARDGFDNTAAFQAAIDSVREKGGTVFAPAGKYLISKHLLVHPYITLKGEGAAPLTTSQEQGTMLLAVEGKGDEDGTPFINLRRCATIQGLQVFYPDQQAKDIQPYPWCVQGIGDNCAIIDCLLVNPYKAVDFGTHPAGRHYIRGLYGSALKTGLFVDKCFDVGRVQDVHFWPFWTEEALEFTRTQGTAFVIGRTDWEYMNNCFCIGYKVGYHFISGADGPGNAVLTQCGSDVGPVAVHVEAVQAHSGVSFVNGQIMATVQVDDTNKGPVKFTACGFWGTEKTTNEHAILAGSGSVSFDNCHFVNWGLRNPDSYAIISKTGSLSITGCEFVDEAPSRRHVLLEDDVEAAVITNNRFRIPAVIDNRSAGDVHISGNVGGKKHALTAALDTMDADALASYWSPRVDRPLAGKREASQRLASAALLHKSNEDLRAALLNSIIDAPTTASEDETRKRTRTEQAISRNLDEYNVKAVAKYTTSPATIDGKLTEKFWPGVKPVAMLTGGTTSVMRLAYDAENLYAFITVSEPHMADIKAKQTERDAAVWTDDCVEIFISPRRMVHRYYQLIVNSKGVLYDGTGSIRSTSADWTSSATTSARHFRDRWNAEVAIPWAGLGVSAPSKGDLWAIDFRRWRFAAGGKDYTSWSNAPLTGDTHHPESYELLIFE